jgi:hypothetical protein
MRVALMLFAEQFLPYCHRLETWWLTFRITGPGVDVNERSEPARLFRLRFIRLLSADLRLVFAISSVLNTRESIQSV